MKVSEVREKFCPQMSTRVSDKHTGEFMWVAEVPCQTDKCAMWRSEYTKEGSEPVGICMLWGDN